VHAQRVEVVSLEKPVECLFEEYRDVGERDVRVLREVARLEEGGRDEAGVVDCTTFVSLTRE